MSFADELLGSLKPFQDSEDYPPYFGLRVGRVRAVYATAEDVVQNDNQDQFVGSIQVQWLDQTSPSDQLIPWAFPVFSNPLIQTTEADTADTPSTPTTQASVGSSYGIFYAPSVGDLVVCGFRGPANPVVIGYLPHNLNKQQLSTDEKSQQGLLSFGPFRSVVPGELALRSLQQAEIYLDRSGTVRVAVKTQPSGSGTPPIDTRQVPTTELAHMSLGVVYDSTFTNPLKSSFGENLVCDIQLSNGSRVQIDSAGNLDINAPSQVNIVGAGNVNVQTATQLHLGATQKLLMSSGGALAMSGLTALLSSVNGMTIGGSSINLNNGSKGAARLDDATISNSGLDSSFWTFMSNLVTIFNAHVHTSAAPGNPTSPTATPLGTAPSSLTGKVNAGSGTVSIG